MNGEPSRPFNIKTKNAVPGSEEVKNKLKELSRLSFGKDREQVETETLLRLRK